MKIDPHKHKERYLNWKEKTKEGISELMKTDSDIIKQFLNEMEFGINVAKGSKKGARSYIRLNTLRDRLIFLSKALKQRFSIDAMVNITEEQICLFFTEMRNGKLKRKEINCFIGRFINYVLCII